MSSLFTVPELAIGVGLSEAASAAFEPKLEVPKQSAWERNPQRVPDLGLIAELIAGGKVSMQDGQNMANRLGFSNGTMESLVWLSQNRLDFPMMLRLWRRFGAFSAGADAELSGLLDQTIAHERLDWDYRPWLRALKTAELPGIGDIAYGVVRGILPAPSWVPVPPPQTTTKVKRFPVVDIDPVRLAAALGYDEDMLRLLVGRSGLSLAPGLAATAFFRQIIAGDDYHLAIAEGDLRTEWADALLDASRQILTAGEYAELQLRGYYDRAERLKNTAKHGMSDADSDLLYDVQGRGLSLHAAFIAERRGGVFKGPTDAIPDWAMFQLQRGNLRPEVYNLAYAGRHTYPSPFVIRGLLTDGAITEAQGEQIYLDVGWPEWLAPLVAQHYAKSASGAAAADPHVTKAENQLWTATHASYVKDRTDDATAEAKLAVLGVAAAAIPQVLALWQEERALVRAGLTPAQIKKAYSEGTFTQPEAVARLVELQWSAADAAVYLGE